MTRTTRSRPEVRAAHIIETAIKLAEERGFRNVTRTAVARAAGVTGPLVSHYFSIDQLLYCVMEAAVERRILPVIAEGVVMRHPVALRCCFNLRSAALSAINTREI